MKDTSTFLPLLSEFISTHFKNYRVWDIEVTFPQSTKETSRGYYTHGLLEVSATNTEDEWDSHSFEFNSPNKIKSDLSELFDGGLLHVFVKNDSIVIWSE